MLIILIVVALLTTGASFYMQNIHTPKAIIKTALKEKELTESIYILCKITAVTGFDWVMIKDENGNATYEHCIIIGASPFNELNLVADFVFSDNTYVFHIEEKNTYYSEEMSMDILEYTVSGWDILYPVKHGNFFNPFHSKKYITNKDLKTR